MNTRFGNIRVIPGEDASRFPHCTSLFIDDDVKVLIDPGAGLKTLAALKQETYIDLVINSHYHFDHITYNYLFDEARIIINEKEAPCYRDRKNIGLFLGMNEVYGPDWVDEWLARIANPNTEQSPFSPQNRHEWWMSSVRVDGEYKWGDIMDFGKTRMQVIGTPGHSRGFSCLNFPDNGVMYIADIDLTAYGPWYGGSDGDIDLFISSCEKIRELDCKYYITGHEKGILNRNDFLAGLDGFLKIIDERDRKILSVITRPLSLQEISNQGLIYGIKYHSDAWIYMWEFIMVKKHLLRMINKGQINDLGNSFIIA